MQHTPAILATALALLALIGCAGDGPDDGAADVAETPAAETSEAEAPAAGTPAAGRPAAGTPVAETSEAETPAADAGALLVDVATTDLGEVLVDGAGLTLYGFLPDEGGTPTCADDCARAWPPLLAPDGLVLDDMALAEGLDEAAFTTVERADGGVQVIAGGWPLYRFAGDAAPGDVKGQGAGGSWFAVDAAGELVQDDAESSQATGPGSDY
jgi:predicted lipoprotein with Yx(FWY)xxD motif